ncbi:MAG: 30S ribosomal protein S9 [Candidatus Woesearchaeota archaeon]
MKVINVSGTRKRAIARATLKKGTGMVKINGKPLDLFEPKYLRIKIQEALILAEKEVQKIDISVRVAGGGPTGQADAARLAIGRGIVAYTENEDIKERYANYDRLLLVADVRRRESRKPNCRGKARSKRQKSYR